jgi:AraC-like DNA-binding protein
MENLKQIPIIRQQHPDISPAMPFDVIREYRYQPMKKFEADMHYAMQFCIMLHGSAEVIFDGFQREYRAGEMWWVMFWEPHAFRFTGRRNFAVAVNIDLEQLGNCDQFGECNWLLPFVVTPAERYCPENAVERAETVAAGRTLLNLWQHHHHFWRIEAWLLIHQLALRACRNLTAAGSAAEFAGGFKKIKNAVDLVKGSIGRPPSLDEAAAACGLSPSRFSEVFRRNTGVSFGKFATRARLSFAANDLKNSTMMIEEVAEKWSFFDNSHFCRAFKDLYGCTPKEYQQKSVE